MKPISVVVVEDNDVLREVTVDFLKGLGHNVVGAIDAESLDECLVHFAADVVILDLNLPGEDGLSISRRLRNASPRLGIIMLTAKGSALQRVQGYESGADIYLAKPTSNEELGAAVASLARRAAPETVWLRCEADSQTLSLRGQLGQESLTDSELKILRGLSMASQQRLEYWQLLDLLGMDNSEDAKSALEVRITRLRKKLVTVGMPDPGIKALRKFGYQMTGAVSLA